MSPVLEMSPLQLAVEDTGQMFLDLSAYEAELTQPTPAAPAAETPAKVAETKDKPRKGTWVEDAPGDPLLAKYMENKTPNLVLDEDGSYRWKDGDPAPLNSLPGDEKIIKAERQRERRAARNEAFRGIFVEPFEAIGQDLRDFALFIGDVVAKKNLQWSVAQHRRMEQSQPHIREQHTMNVAMRSLGRLAMH